MAERLQWGIVGTGSIAHAFAKGLAESKTGKLIAVGSRRQESADKFGDEFDLPTRHGSYEALLADSGVEAVYIATPHPLHAQWAIRAAEAGKHVLCEKPLALNHAEAMAVVEAAREHDVFLMEAFMYRCHPQTGKLVELIRSGAIGRVGVIQATFSFHAGFNPEGRLFKQALGGGGILDVGCYCTSMARLIAGAAAGKDFEEPVEVKGAGHLGESRIDDYAIASLKFPNGILAQLATGVRLSQENVVRIFGSEGWILAPSPWVPSREGEPTKIIVHRSGKESEEIVVESDRPLYTMEADTVAANIGRRQAAPPAMSWEDTLGNMRTLDAWRASIGLVYEMEKPGAQALTVAGRPLAVRPPNKMRYGRIAGVRMAVSRLVMGADNQGTMPHASVMFDEYFERGGNCFDTAYIYGGGRPERLLGEWVKSRGVRDQVVIIAKGAHTPDNRPERLAPQLRVSLDRMQIDYADIHLAHRDNPEIAVGEWADAWNELLRAGLIRAYGGANWALERVEALNEYARSKGLVGMACVSNNFSLARMVSPVWGGCIAASDAESRGWLARTQLPLLCWSSQARGFFTERARRDDLSDDELVRGWYSDDNFQRKARAEELGRRRGVAPIVIALAYVLCQPFPTFALIGPRLLSEMRQSMQALDIELSPEELKWLNLET
jgi:predicted dehydrogenase/aryl-alcohol dehydrogenase-like predicted oxidoreductase